MSLKKKLSVSVARAINISVIYNGMKRACIEYIEKAFYDFEDSVCEPMCEIEIGIELFNPIEKGLVVLGKDAKYKQKYLKLDTGHQYLDEDEKIKISVPAMVKRGRIPFKRKTPGRHVVDEVIEPVIVSLLQKFRFKVLHASAILDNNDHATVNMAWRHTGKTKKIIQYIKTGKILSDDLTIISKEGIVYAYPRPLRMYHYNISDLPISKNKKKIYRLKSFIKPNWQPVEYISLAPKIMECANYKIIYLNDPEEIVNDILIDNIMDFELTHFFKVKTLLKIAGIL